jgi:uncharacterized membrane protein
MSWIRKILWIAGGLIFAITFLTMLSQVYWEAKGWDGIDMGAYIFWYVLGAICILSMFIYDLGSFLLLRSDVHSLMDETEQTTPEGLAKELDKPLWRVLPIFRKREDPGILIELSGKYKHFNEDFEKKFLEQYSKGLPLGDLANHFNLPKTEISLILEELDYKGDLPEIETPIDHPTKETQAKGLRKTVRLRKREKRRRK